jgi:protein-S-isoprenylcysteine O-methyltransferase Ste14
MNDPAMSTAGETKPGRALPPVFLLAALIAMEVLHAFWPGTRLISPPFTYLGWILFSAGVAAAVSVKLSFDRVGTPIKPYEISEHLVTDGLFAYSRNPVYVGMILGLSGIAVILGTLSPALVVPVFAYIIRSRFIAVEERMLEERFGDAYRDYTSAVRRWI